MASFFIREHDAAYRAVVKYRDADGVWRQKTRVFAKKGDARSWALEETTKSETVVLTRNASPTLAEYLDQYEPSIARHHRGYTNSERFRLSTLRNSWLGKIHIDQISSDLVRRYRDQRTREVSNDSVRRELGVLSGALSYAPEFGHPITNPVKDIKLPKKGAHRDRRMSREEAKRFWATAKAFKNPTFYRLCSVAVETGLRQGKLLDLKSADIDWKSGLIAIELDKNGDPHWAPLSPSAVETLKEQIAAAKTEKVFSYYPRALKRAWSIVCERAKVDDFRFHDLRHERVSSLVEAGWSLPVIGRVTNHRDLQSQRRYINLQRKEAAKGIAEKLAEIPSVVK